MSRGQVRNAAKVLGRFELLRVLGEGAQGTVYLARDPHLGREVAIKTLQHAATDRAAIARLLQEARTVSRLAHPNIVALHDAGEADGHPYLVFEFVPGETLAQVLAREAPLPPARALGIVLDLLDGVAHAHAAGILHRDLKPGNVIFGSTGAARIMDFGIAIPVTAGGAQGFAGTPLYAAPEYVERGEYSPASDLYAVAAVLYEMLTGQPAIGGASLAEVLERVARDRPRPPSRLNGGIDEKLDALVLRGLAKRPEQRFASARDMAGELRTWLEPSVSAAADGAVNASTIEFLLRRMRVKSEFPALSETMRAINRIAASDRESASALARVILKDFALTNRLLKIVNAATYGQYGKVSTISRAVVIVGFEVVRNLAVTLLFLDHLQNRAQAGSLKEDVVGSLLTGFLAKQIAGSHDLHDGEELFICALYQNLGRLLATYYFFEESQEIERLQASGRLGEDQAAHQVLGVNYRQLGVEIARLWNFPERILHSMQRLPPGKAPAPRSEDDRVRAIANLADELRGVIATAPEAERAAHIQRLGERYAGCVACDPERLARAARGALEEFAREAIGFKIEPRQSPVLRQAQAFVAQSGLGGAGAEAGAAPADALGEADLEKTLVNDVPELSSTLPGGKPVNAAAILSAGIQDITNTLVSDYKLNDLLNMIMETMYRGMGFGRVLLAVRDIKSGAFAGRFALGEDSEGLLRPFNFPLAGPPDLFRLALSQGRDILITDAGADKIRGQLPEWYRERINAPAFIVFPIVVGKNPVGLFYADVQRGPLAIERDEANLLVTLRNQAVLAFKQATLR